MNNWDLCGLSQHAILALHALRRDIATYQINKMKTFGDKAFSVQAAKLWNTLQEDLRGESSLSVFKVKLSRYHFLYYVTILLYSTILSYMCTPVLFIFHYNNYVLSFYCFLLLTNHL